MSYDAAFIAVVGIEGKYSNDPRDSGGETMYGITVAVARAHGYTGAMRDLPIDRAKAIYKAQYWDLLRLGDIDIASSDVALELFDTAVNMGVGIAARMLQRVLNVLNRQGTDYPDVVIDGVIGPMTLSGFRQLLQVRGTYGEIATLRLLNCLQGTRYVELAESRPKDENFVFGWVMNRIHV